MDYYGVSQVTKCCTFIRCDYTASTARDFDLFPLLEISPRHKQGTQRYMCDALGAYSACVSLTEYDHKCYTTLGHDNHVLDPRTFKMV